jgi:hypothetical protein
MNIATTKKTMSLRMKRMTLSQKTHQSLLVGEV